MGHTVVCLDSGCPLTLSFRVLPDDTWMLARPPPLIEIHTLSPCPPSEIGPMVLVSKLPLTSTYLGMKIWGKRRENPYCSLGHLPNSGISLLFCIGI